MSYCVPHHYVCDGKLDCPYGEDEDHCLRTCPGMLRCRSSNVCVHKNYVGDNQTDCIETEDDEILQDLMPCREKGTCMCLGSALSCPFANLSSLPLEINNNKYKAIIFVGNRIGNLSNLPQLSLLLLLNISRNQLMLLSNLTFRNMANLVSLDVSCNSIAALDSSGFAGLKHLRLLNLANNFICCINPTTFRDLSSLEVLNLSNNTLHTTSPDGFKWIQHSLIQLHYQGNLVTREFLIAVDYLRNLKLLSLDLGSHCLYIPRNIKCDFVVKNHIPCCRIINSKFLFWITCTFIATSLFFNITCIIYASLEDQNVIVKLLSLLLHSSDTLIALYFILILAVDTYYNDMYLFYHLTVSRGLICHILAFVLALGDFLSLESVAFNCYQRLYIVAWPLKEIRASSYKWYVLIYVSSVVMLLLIFLIPIYISRDQNLTTTACVLAPVVGIANSMWLYFLLYYFSSNFIIRITAVVFTAFGIQKLQAPLSESLRCRGGRGNKRSAAFRSRLIIFENLCSLLIACVIQTVLLLFSIDSTTFITASIPLYLRCLVHPVLYTFSTQKFLKRAMFLLRKITFNF